MALWCVTQRSDGSSKPAFLLHALLARQIYTHVVLSTSFSVFCIKLDVNFSMPMDLQHYYFGILIISAPMFFFSGACINVSHSLRSVQVLSQPRNSLHFVEPEDSLPLSHEPATCTYLQLNQSSPCPPSHFLNNHINTVHLSTYMCFKLSLSFRSPQQNPIAPLLFPIRSKCPIQLIFLDSITTRILIDEEYRFYSSPLCSLLPSLLGPNIFLITVFSNSLTPCSSISATGQVNVSYTKFITAAFSFAHNTSRTN